MPYDSKNYAFRQKAVRVTIPLICDDHIDAVIGELSQAVADLRQIRKSGVRQFERVLAAQAVMHRAHTKFMAQAKQHTMLKGLR